jgi:hypothetical protein
VTEVKQNGRELFMLKSILKQYSLDDISLIISDLLMLVQDDSEMTVSERIADEFGYNSEITNALLAERASRF